MRLDKIWEERSKSMTQTGVINKVPASTVEKFRYPVFVSIGDTNMEGNVYWLNYFKWFGIARERFLISVFPDFLKMFASGMATIITHETSIKHIASAFFADEVTLEIWLTDVRKTSARMMVDFVKKSTGEKLAEGWQMLVFGDKQGHPAPLPPELREAVLKYVAPSGTIG